MRLRPVPQPTSSTVPPGGRAKAHMHEGHETAIFVLSGEVDKFVSPYVAQELQRKVTERKAQEG